jgi:hypothetical protein
MDLNDTGTPSPEFTPSRIAAGNYRRLLRDLYLYWHFVRGQEQGIALLQHGLVPKPTLRLLNAGLRVPDEVEAARTEFEMERLYFLRRLLLQSGLLTIRKNRLYAADEQGYFALPSLQRIYRCLQDWLDDPYWHDLAHLPGIAIRPEPAPDEMTHARLLDARRALVALLGQQTANTWIPLSAFAGALGRIQPDLLFPPRPGGSDRYTPAGNPYRRDFRIQRPAQGMEDSRLQVETALVSRAIAEPLHWLGVVDIAWSQERPWQPEAFRLNLVGAALLCQPPETFAQVTDRAGKVRIQPDFTIVATEPVSESLLLHLDRFARRESLDRAIMYRLTRETTGAAIQRGMTAGDILHTLEAWAEVPQNVSYTLHDWERQAGRLRLHQHATLLEVAEPEILDHLMGDETLRRGLQRLTPTTALVDREMFARVYDALVAAGELPFQSRPFDDDAAPEKAWYVQGEAALVSPWPVPDRYLEQQLAPYVTLTYDGKLVFEPRQLRNAIAQATSQSSEAKQRADIFPDEQKKQQERLEWLLAFLDRHVMGGLPATWRLRLNVWAGKYRDAFEVIRGPFLLLQDAQLLNALRADPAVGPLLGPVLPQGSILVRLDEAALTALRDLLSERGIALPPPEGDALSPP